MTCASCGGDIDCRRPRCRHCGALPIPPDVEGFAVTLDQRAVEWLAANTVPSPIVIAYSVTRCCGGTRLCDVRLQVKGLGALRSGRFARIDRVADRDVLMDDRILKTMPRCIPITAHKFLGQSRLRLDLTGEQWGRVLFA